MINNTFRMLNLNIVFYFWVRKLEIEIEIERMIGILECTC